MTYPFDRTSDPVGTGLLTGAQIDVSFSEPAQGIGQELIDACQRFRLSDGRTINSDVASGQIHLETAGGTSRIFLEKWNPGGIGAENDDPFGKAITFPSRKAGVTAFVCGLVVYNDPTPDPAVQLLDPRYAVRRKAGFVGIVQIEDKALYEYEQRYAWSPQPAYDATPVELRYGAKIAKRANQIWERSGEHNVVYEVPNAIAGIPVRKSFIPAGNSNRPGTPANAEGLTWITVHETGNPTSGADAEMHRKYVHNGGGAVPPNNDGVSFTFVVDDHEIVWLLPLEEKSWQASDGANGTGNSSASIETCVNADGDWLKTLENLAQLVAHLATNAPGRSVDRIAQHNHWARDHKDCPHRLRLNDEAGWTALMQRVRQIATQPTPPADDKLILPDTPGDFGFIAGFKAWVEQQGRARYPVSVVDGIKSITGFPLADEYKTAFGSAQVCERCVLLWFRDAKPPWDIVLKLTIDPIPEAVP